MRPLSIDGTWLFEPRVFPDQRGSFHEWFKIDDFDISTGQRRLSLAQANFSVSTRGTLRGIHFADVPPGQAKYIKCVHGAILDVIVDIRIGSPTFGQWQSVRLDDQLHHAVYVAEGLGHAFMALTEEATVVYLCSEGYSPEHEHGIHPLDADLGIEWPPDIEPMMSPKDAVAPTLAIARKEGLLPTYDACTALYKDLRG